jgi:nucleosome binding factor SPN SPT16 subunit
MKDIVADPEGFFELGGWNFLEPSEEDVRFLTRKLCVHLIN